MAWVMCVVWVHKFFGVSQKEGVGGEGQNFGVGGVGP